MDCTKVWNGSPPISSAKTSGDGKLNKRNSVFVVDVLPHQSIFAVLHLLLLRIRSTSLSNQMRIPVFRSHNNGAPLFPTDASMFLLYVIFLIPLTCLLWVLSCQLSWWVGLVQIEADVKSHVENDDDLRYGLEGGITSD